MPAFYSPSGNIEIWAQKPDGYLTPDEWDAAHPSPEPPELTEQEKREERQRQLKAELSALDLQAVRPLRAIAAGTATDVDHAKLADLEAQAEKLRAELSTLGGN